MIRQLIHPLYRAAHRGLYATRSWNPLLRTAGGGRPAKEGHLSAEHLAHPALDDQLEKSFRDMGISVEPYTISVSGYRDYLTAAGYPADYYGGGTDPENNFTEKTLEHFVSLDFLRLGPGSVFVDIAACTSPFADIVQRLRGVTESYRQDLVYARGLHGRQIGGWAHELPLPEGSVDGVTLHCSLEHFEAQSDTQFFQTLARVLRPGGRAVVLPFYLGHTYSIHVDPAFNFLKRHQPQGDPQAELRYCDWRQYFSRHYDPAALQRRILSQAPELTLTLYRVQNFREVDDSCYLRWVGVFERK